MKRYSAGNSTDVRKRTDSEVSRHFGPLTEIEIEDIRQAYLDGCRGEVIIGLRGDERIITMLVPAQTDSKQAKILEQILQVLRTIGCERCQRIRSGS